MNTVPYEFIIEATEYYFPQKEESIARLRQATTDESLVKATWNNQIVYAAEILWEISKCPNCPNCYIHNDEDDVLKWKKEKDSGEKTGEDSGEKGEKMEVEVEDSDYSPSSPV
jgi:hypothetical protein